MEFSGFSRGTTYTPTPDPLFGPLLEGIQDLAELKVTLRGLWLLHRKRGGPRVLSLEEFLYDRVLLRGLRSEGSEPEAVIRRGLDSAVARRTFLLYQPQGDNPDKRFYLLNTDSDRRALDRMQRDRGFPPRDELLDKLPGPGNPPEPPAADRPNIFGLYEDNVGLLSPIIAEQLKEAEELYPAAWITEAFKIAVTRNRRSWSYIAAILGRWAAEGKDYGKPGGHSPKDSRERYLEEYQRRRGHLPWEQGEQGERGERAGR